jgi:hypothetical protein
LLGLLVRYYKIRCVQWARCRARCSYRWLLCPGMPLRTDAHTPTDTITCVCVQEGGDCGSCGYSASRIKGYWPSTGANNWAWVYPAALSNPTACSPEIMDAVAAEKQRLQELKPAASANLRNATINPVGDTCVAECRAAGKYVVSQPGGAMVRGGTSK